MAIAWVTNPQHDLELMKKHHAKSFCDRLVDMKLSSSILYGTNSTALLGLSQGQYTCYTGDEPQPKRNASMLEPLDAQSIDQNVSEGVRNMPCDNSLVPSGDEYESGALHHAVLGTGVDGPLQADTHYHYRVGDPNGALSELYSFKMPPELGPNSFPYRLGLIGDLGQTENSMETLDHAAALEPDSILNVGDLSYADGYQPRYISLAACLQALEVL